MTWWCRGCYQEGYQPLKDATSLSVALRDMYNPGNTPPLKVCNKTLSEVPPSSCWTTQHVISPRCNARPERHPTPTREPRPTNPRRS